MVTVSRGEPGLIDIKAWRPFKLDSLCLDGTRFAQRGDDLGDHIQLEETGGRPTV